MRTERIVQRLGEGLLRTPAGEFRTIAYGASVDSERHLALVFGDVEQREDVLVRVHSHCVYGDVFGAVTCECRRTMEQSLERIAKEGCGVLVYLHQTGMGIGINAEGRMLPHSRRQRRR